MFYFAYGSNMDFQRLRKREVEPRQPHSAVLKGYKLAFNKKADAGGGEGYANIMARPGEDVEGIIIEVEESDLIKLDGAESVKFGHYKRYPVTVRMEGGKQVDATTYVAQPGKVMEGLKPRKRYLNYLLAGKEYLSNNYYLFLRNIKTLD